MSAPAGRLAAIDCGTNSVRLLVADPGGGGGLVEVRREMRIVRLGEDVDRTGRLAPAALARTREALVEYRNLMRRDGVSRVRMVATSATRDAANRDEFAAMVHEVLGVEPEVVSGAQEAALSFAGVAAAVDGGPLLVTDIGGGSTELVLGAAGPAPRLRAHSMPVGSVRMTERHFADDPPTGAQVAAVVADVRAALDVAAGQVPLDTGARLVGVAGTVTTVAALALRLPRYERAAIDGAVLAAGQVREVTDRLLAMSRSQRAAEAAIHPGRVDVIAAGAVVLRTVLERIGAHELTVSEHDLLDGIALGIAR